jgi:hypothetical protein
VRAPWLPPLALAAYALAFAVDALSGGLLVTDDHPGQLYRLVHALHIGLAPWRLNSGWWAGYAELQYYPPGFAYLGALIHAAFLGRLDAATTYRILLWLAFLLPGATTYALLMRVLRNPWLALPGAFAALALSGGSRSGVEEGLRWGLIAARLGWAVLPMLAWSLQPWTERRPPPIVASAWLAVIILIHPAHAPAGAALILLAAWYGPGVRRARLAQAALVIAGGVGLAAFWLLPLIAHLDMALPLAWDQRSLSELAASIAERPLLVCLVAATVIGRWCARREVEARRWLSDWAGAIAVVTVLDALAAESLGIAWLPADRLLDGFLLASIVGASIALGDLARRVAWLPPPLLAIGVIVGAVLLSSPRSSEPTLTLWPRGGRRDWAIYQSVTASSHVAQLWSALEAAPAGRVLFIRSSVPLEKNPNWWRAHSHITALTPLAAHREILNGTFTHPSPIAGLVYTGAAVNRPITRVVEQLDGVALFGRPLAALTAARFRELTEPLRVSAVVALGEDEGRLAFVADDPDYLPPARIGPFVLFISRAPHPTPARVGAQRWQVPSAPTDEGWVRTGMAYSPLWRARARGERLPARRDTLGLLEVKPPSGYSAEIDLEHRPGAAEWSALALSGASALAMFVWLIAARLVTRGDRS